MQQKTPKVSKRRIWSVYVFIEREVISGRSMMRRSRLTAKQQYVRLPGKIETVLHKFLYLNVTKVYKKNGILYIVVGAGKNKEQHMHDLKSVNSIQVREHDPSGRVE
jgi:hypothetical protein